MMLYVVKYDIYPDLSRYDREKIPLREEKAMRLKREQVSTGLLLLRGSKRKGKQGYGVKRIIARDTILF